MVLEAKLLASLCRKRSLYTAVIQKLLRKDVQNSLGVEHDVKSKNGCIFTQKNSSLYCYDTKQLKRSIQKCCRPKAWLLCPSKLNFVSWLYPSYTISSCYIHNYMHCKPGMQTLPKLLGNRWYLMKLWPGPTFNVLCVCCVHGLKMIKMTLSNADN